MQGSKAEVLASVRRQRARTVALVSSLTEAEWETVALPGWRVREVIGHLVSSDEGAMKLRMLRIKGGDDGGLSAIEAWNEKETRRWSERPVRELVGGLEKWGRITDRLFRATPSPLLKVKVPMPFGSMPLLSVGRVRIFDEWVHEQDIRRAIGKPDDDRSAAMEAAHAMLVLAPRQTPSRIPGGLRGTAAVVVGDVALVCDLASKTFAERPASSHGADATITGDAGAIVMVAAGRDAWRDAEKAGTISIEGDRAIGEALLEALRAA